MKPTGNSLIMYYMINRKCEPILYLLKMNMLTSNFDVIHSLFGLV